jgi:predicted HTH domain antitoxin
MQQTIHIQCPTELLKGLQVSAEAFAELIKLQAAIALFKQGQISSGMAAKWLNMPRVTFLMLAMEAGAELLENTTEDFEREMALLSNHWLTHFGCCRDDSTFDQLEVEIARYRRQQEEDDEKA